VESYHILVTEDEPFTLSLMSSYLVSNGFRVSRASTGYETLKTIENEKVDLLVLDLNLPDENGLALLRQIRMTSTLTTVVSTQHGGESYRNAAMDLGAVDYLVKPYEPEDLVRIIRENLPDVNKTVTHTSSSQTMIGPLCLDLRARVLTNPAGVEQNLSPIEARVLQALGRTPGTILSRAQLLDACSTDPHASERMVDVIVCRLRGKIDVLGMKKKCRILAVPRVGYKLVVF